MTPQAVTKVYLLRHGQTAFNVSGRLRGRADLELNITGCAQAEALGELFAGVPLARVLASPMHRAIKTARPVARVAGLEVEAVAGLNDRDYGEWTGAIQSDVERRFGSLDAAPGVESWDALRQRVLATFNALRAASRGPAIVLVGHDATNRALLTTLVADLEGQPGDVPQDNGCWNRLEWHEDRWELAVLNARPGDGQWP